MLDERKQDAITYLLKGEGPTEVGRKVGVTKATIWNWQNKDKEFQEELERRRKEIAKAGNDYVTANLQSHLEVLHDIAVGKSDKRTACTAAMYLVDRALGKPTFRNENVKSGDGDQDIDIDILDQEFAEVDLNSEIRLVK